MGRISVGKISDTYKYIVVSQNVLDGLVSWSVDGGHTTGEYIPLESQI